MKGEKRVDMEKAFASAQNVVLDSMLDSSTNALELLFRHGGGANGVGKATNVAAVGSQV